jgi:hypothetical protein
MRESRLRAERLVVVRRKRVSRRRYIAKSMRGKCDQYWSVK